MNNFQSEDSFPYHVAIIMDGNNRWAVDKKLPGVSGHQEGVNKVRELVEFSAQIGIEVLTLFAFSSENWERSQEEVSLLMDLFAQAIEKEVPNLIKNEVAIRFIGDLSKFDEALRKKMQSSEARTATDSKKLDLVIAVSYGGRWDILQATKKLYSSSAELESFTEEDFSKNLSLSDFKDPDLCIRTGGELRISNFLLWQLAYTEFYFTDCLWPDFTKEEFENAIKEFTRRKRNFGNKSNFNNP
tara:strand:- start:3337 stop:4065 length:729 start_codon:yes stop_codon:yes gene_type:complete